MVKKTIMANLKELIAKERSQYLILISISFGVMLLAGILYFSNTSSFRPYFGKINPLVVIFLTIILGFVLLSFLLSKSWFVIYKKENLRGLLFSSGLAALFAVAIILVDLTVVFPDDLNILFPESLLFYPAIGYVVEILFHVLPLSLLFFFLTIVFRKINYKKIIWISILTVSLLEPVYQTIPFITGQYPLWAVIYVGLHVFLINLVQLLIFKQYDFVSMYSFRLVYYILWHILWGYMRLELLF